jgi:hypothetical protein
MAKNESEKKALKAIDKAVKKAIKSQGKLERIVVGSEFQAGESALTPS